MCWNRMWEMHSAKLWVPTECFPLACWILLWRRHTFLNLMLSYRLKIMDFYNVMLCSLIDRYSISEELATYIPDKGAASSPKCWPYLPDYRVPCSWTSWDKYSLPWEPQQSYHIYVGWSFNFGTDFVVSEWLDVVDGWSCLLGSSVLVLVCTYSSVPATDESTFGSHFL